MRLKMVDKRSIIRGYAEILQEGQENGKRWHFWEN